MKLGRSVEESIWVECLLYGLACFVVLFGLMLGIHTLIRGEFNLDAVSPVASLAVAGLIAARHGVTKAFRAGRESLSQPA